MWDDFVAGDLNENPAKDAFPCCPITLQSFVHHYHAVQTCPAPRVCARLWAIRTVAFLFHATSGACNFLELACFRPLSSHSASPPPTPNYVDHTFVVVLKLKLTFVCVYILLTITSTCYHKLCVRRLQTTGTCKTGRVKRLGATGR